MSPAIPSRDMQKAPRTIFVVLSALLLGFALSDRLAADDAAPAGGVAKGTYAPKGEKPATLTNAAALVDVKDDEKPVIVIVSDKKIPTEKWTSEFDLIEAKADLAFSGIVFFIDKEGKVFRTDLYWKGQQSSTSGVYEVKLDSAAGAKEITGSAKTIGTDPDDPKLDVKFHATLK